MAAGDIKIIANEGYVDNKVSVVDSKVDVVSKSSNPFSGYMEYTKKADNFVFEESEAFAGKVGDKNRYLDFNGDLVDTRTHADYDDTRECVVADLSDKIPDVTVQDQATNGLTTQSDVSAGDYVVVDREELVTNGTFDSDPNLNWDNNNNNVALSLDSGRLKVENVNAVYGYSSQSISTNVGKKYILKYDSQDSTSCVAYINDVQGEIKRSYVEAKNTIIEFTAREATTEIRFGNASNSIGYFSLFDNISVKQVDESYKAIQDAPAGTELTDTEYFENRDQQGIYNQAAVLHKYDPSTKTYLGMVSEVLFNEMEANETPKQFMLKNGFSQISEGCYSKDGYYYIVSGVYSTYNSGCHHPDYNFYGCRKASDDNFWYESSDTFTCVADCF
jgi:hypothetical protein